MGVLDKLKRRIAEERTAARQTAAANKRIRLKQRAAYLKAKESEAITFARQKAASERARKTRRLTRGNLTFSQALSLGKKKKSTGKRRMVRYKYVKAPVKRRKRKTNWGKNSGFGFGSY